MHIFIDESGLFATASNPKNWSSVGGVVIPDASLNAISSALNTLKIAHGIDPGTEFKRVRPDCSSEAYMVFLRTLDETGCTLHVTSTRSPPTETADLEAHKNNTIAAIRNYAKITPDANTPAEDVINLVRKISLQEYNQCILQTQMMCWMLPNILTHYSSIAPDELGRFNWILDRKNESETRYERAFKELYIGLIMTRSKRDLSAIMVGSGRDYSAFARAFSPNVDVGNLLQSSKHIYGIDHTHLIDSVMAVSFGSLLQDEFSLKDSKSSFGIQVADLLVSSVNRCIKRHYTENEKMATALGRLMINAPRIEDRCIMVAGYSSTRPIANAPAKLIKLMDDSSKKIYSQAFRTNYSKNCREQKNMQSTP